MESKIDMPNFTWRELEYSSKALELGINNSTPQNLIDNGNRLLRFLQDVRDAYGKPMIISSGYRCEALNKAVRGSRRSSHLYCLAADIQVRGSWSEFIEFIKDYMKDKSFDQVIIESSGNTRWLHIGIDHPELGQRGQLFSMRV